MKKVKYYKTYFNNEETRKISDGLHTEEGSGYEFTLTDENNNTFTFYKEYIDKEWRITEKTTGTVVAEAKTQEEALAKCEKRLNDMQPVLNKHKEFFAPCIALMKEAYGDDNA